MQIMQMQTTRLQHTGLNIVNNLLLTVWVKNIVSRTLLISTDILRDFGKDICEIQNTEIDIKR